MSADRIVFANPCKRPKDLRCAADRGVELTTFDTEAGEQVLNMPSLLLYCCIKADHLLHRGW